MSFKQHVDKLGTAVREKAVKNPETNVWFRASTPKVDRYGEIVKPTGIRVDNFMKNPIFGWGHQVYGMAEKKNIIGRIVDFEASFDSFDAEAEFIPTAGMEDGTGYSYLDMVKGNFLNAVSIGFGGLSWHDETIEGSMVRVWDEVDLMEVSLVTIPAQPHAVKKALDAEFEKQILKDFSRLEAPPQDADTAEAIRKAFAIYKINQAFTGKNQE